MSIFKGKTTIPHQNYHGNYAYPCGRVAMSNNDGMSSGARVPTVRCTWGHVVMSCRASH
jgi:hypothetical protein